MTECGPRLGFSSRHRTSGSADLQGRLPVRPPTSSCPAAPSWSFQSGIVLLIAYNAWNLPSACLLRSSKSFADPAGKTAAPWSGSPLNYLCAKRQFSLQLLDSPRDLGRLYEQALCWLEPQEEGTVRPRSVGLSRRDGDLDNHGSVAIQVGCRTCRPSPCICSLLTPGQGETEAGLVPGEFREAGYREEASVFRLGTGRVKQMGRSPGPQK